MSDVGSPLVAVAHGSRDSRSAATVRALVRRAGALCPHHDIRVAFLDLSSPRVSDVLAQVHAEGHRHAVVLPLLLGSAYHARTDLPALVDDVTRTLPRFKVSIADVLGIDPLLESVALARLEESGADPADAQLGVVLAAVGSTHTPANTAVTELASRWHRSYACAVTPAFASAAKPDVRAAIARLRARGASRFALASWFLAPGLLPDRVAELARQAAPEVTIAEPLGAAHDVAELIVRRYERSLAKVARTA